MLLRKLEDRCRAGAFHAIRLEVRKSNLAALAFYEGHGYSVAGDIRNFYLNGEDAYQMIKVLQS
jgi:ribosomal protein S18 acetylase RimI-like enzyme